MESSDGTITKSHDMNMITESANYQHLPLNLSVGVFFILLFQSIQLHWFQLNNRRELLLSVPVQLLSNSTWLPSDAAHLPPAAAIHIVIITRFALCRGLS